MATDWLHQYNAHLDIRDQRESLHNRYIDAYTSLADRTAAAAAPATAPAPTSALPTRASPTPKRGASSSPASGPAHHDTTDLSVLRTSLAASNAARATLTADLTSLRTTHAALGVSHATLTAQHAAMQRRAREMEVRVRDRDHELREKSKLVLGVQDEMVALELALNVAEERTRVAQAEVVAMEAKVAKVGGENEALVKRWLERVGEEARAAGIDEGTDYRGSVK